MEHQKIQRSDLDGSNIEDVVSSGIGNIGDIALNIQALLPISLMNFTANAQNQTTLLFIGKLPPSKITKVSTSKEALMEESGTP